jgi:hypothetical protein
LNQGGHFRNEYRPLILLQLYPFRLCLHYFYVTIHTIRVLSKYCLFRVIPESHRIQYNTSKHVRWITAFSNILNATQRKNRRLWSCSIRNSILRLARTKKMSFRIKTWLRRASRKAPTVISGAGILRSIVRCEGAAVSRNVTGENTTTRDWFRI